MPHPTGHTARPSILLVEDNEMIQTLIVDLLGGAYDVEPFEAAEPALARAAERAFSLVLLDISLPRMPGTKAIGLFRELPAYTRTPIVAMTGHTSPEQHAQYLRMGFTDHLAKPFLPDDLLDMLERLVG